MHINILKVLRRLAGKTLLKICLDLTFPHLTTQNLFVKDHPWCRTSLFCRTQSEKCYIITNQRQRSIQYVTQYLTFKGCLISTPSFLASQGRDNQQFTKNSCSTLYSNLIRKQLQGNRLHCQPPLHLCGFMYKALASEI